jgi:hypothetical protein
MHLNQRVTVNSILSGSRHHAKGPAHAPTKHWPESTSGIARGAGDKNASCPGGLALSQRIDPSRPGPVPCGPRRLSQGGALPDPVSASIGRITSAMNPHSGVIPAGSPAASGVSISRTSVFRSSAPSRGISNRDRSGETQATDCPFKTTDEIPATWSRSSTNSWRAGSSGGRPKCRVKRSLLGPCGLQRTGRLSRSRIGLGVPVAQHSQPPRSRIRCSFTAALLAPGRHVRSRATADASLCDRTTNSRHSFWLWYGLHPIKTL